MSKAQAILILTKAKINWMCDAALEKALIQLPLDSLELEAVMTMADGPSVFTERGY